MVSSSFKLQPSIIHSFFFLLLGLVTLIQSSSVLAHKHESNNHLVLPTTQEEEDSMPPSWSDSLGLQYDEVFTEMNKAFDSQSCLLAVHR